MSQCSSPQKSRHSPKRLMHPSYAWPVACWRCDGSQADCSSLSAAVCVFKGQLKVHSVLASYSTLIATHIRQRCEWDANWRSILRSAPQMLTSLTAEREMVARVQPLKGSQRLMKHEPTVNLRQIQTQIKFEINLLPSSGQSHPTSGAPPPQRR